MSKKPYGIDIPVLIEFFTRHETLIHVFQSVKEARPSVLYLHQDGPREGRHDEENILKCREIVDDANIDWDCEVHRLYRVKNVGCDPGGYFAQRWFFDNVEMGIVLEDDTVPSQSFYPFCKELLEKYKDNHEVSIIAGVNSLGISKDVSSSYFFTKMGGIWGWATWRRFIDLEDPSYSWLDDSEKIKHIKAQLTDAHFNSFYRAAIWHRDTGKEYFETLYQAAQYLNNGYAIVPKFNLVSNIGVVGESEHNVSEIRLLPKRTQKLFLQKAYEIDFPLKHPTEIQRNIHYEKKKTTNKFQKAWNTIEYGLRVLRYKGPKAAINLVKKKINK